MRGNLSERLLSKLGSHMMEAYDKKVPFSFAKYPSTWCGEVHHGQSAFASAYRGWNEDGYRHGIHNGSHRYCVWRDSLLIQTRRGKKIDLPLPHEDHLDHRVLFGYAINDLNKGELYSYPFTDDEWVHYGLYADKWRELSRTIYRDDGSAVNTKQVLDRMKS
jgi:hypothetical protein